MDLTPRKRAKIVALSKHAKKSVREIGKELGIPKSTLAGLLRGAMTTMTSLLNVGGDAEEKGKRLLETTK